MMKNMDITFIWEAQISTCPLWENVLRPDSFISSTGSCTQMCYLWKCSGKRNFQPAWDANGKQIMHEPYFINLKHFSMKIRQHIHPFCCSVVFNSMFSSDEHIQNRTLLELLSTACLQTSLKSIILRSLFSCISYFVSLWEAVFWTYLYNLLGIL